MSRMLSNQHKGYWHEGRVLKQGQRNKYLIAVLSYEGTQKTFSVHRLVAETFMPNPLKKREVNHKDFNTLNNSLENLEWVTPKENMQHLSKSGRNPATVKGEKNTNSKLTVSKVSEIKKLFKCNSNRKIAKMFGVSPALIGMIKNRKIWNQHNEGEE